MADKKDKKDAKPAAKPAKPSPKPIEIVLAELIVVAALLFTGIALLNDWSGVSIDIAEEWKAFFIGLVSSLQAIAAFISLLFVMGIIYAKFRMGQLERQSKLAKKVQEAEQKKVVKQASAENKKWQKVLEHVASPNPSDWRLSILEADILLGDLLTKMGYKGEGIGEQLKSVEKSDFHTLDEAWEAHKVRNKVAHDGSDFPLNQREAQRVIALYEAVFKEFYFI